MDYTYASVIVADADRGQAQADLGDGFFNSPLSATGGEPATHWMSSGPWSNVELGQVCNQSPDGFQWPYKIHFGQDWQTAIEAEGLVPVVGGDSVG